MSQLLLGLLLALAASTAAWRTGALSSDGALAAALIGTAAFGIGGLEPAVLVIAFFVSSSALSFFGRRRKARLRDMWAKGSQRDWRQVVANGGLAGLLAIGFGLRGGTAWLAALTGALAAVTADTWATELGVLAGGVPRLITSGRRVEPGTSGGVTWQGSLASLGGGSFLGGAAAAMGGGWVLLASGAGAGLVGSIADSLLGASLQARYHCRRCDRATEQHPVHRPCGTRTDLVGGVSWLDNDGVNLAASGVGALLGWALWLLI